MSSRRQWTDEDDEALAEMRAVGARAAEIAWALDRTVPAVNMRASELGITRKHGPVEVSRAPDLLHGTDPGERDDDARDLHSHDNEEPGNGLLSAV
jgi:hypothetical protein